ncbi:MAG: hypothetical protein HRT90_00025 [Candidatus Margulisbacteria bacterium]|nr:hypothetical protein [Candidatus Margulisiibacteriota bacterium]
MERFHLDLKKVAIHMVNKLPEPMLPGVIKYLDDMIMSTNQRLKEDNMVKVPEHRV